jgi:CheY-like chemotaxis protein
MHGALPLVTLFGAVAVAAFYGGVGPGVVTALLGYFACNYWLIAPLHGFTLDSAATLTGFIVYLATNAVIIGVVEAARLSRLKVPPGVTSAGPGQGAEFTVRLPIGREVPLPPPASWPGRPRAKSSGRHVLVVDDNHDSAATLASLLRMSGNEVALAHDGEEAVVAAEKLRPDVVVLDIGLPKLNGYDACRRIRAQPWGRGVVLVALTGWGQQEDRRQALEAGFDHHMVKPVDFERLAQVLAREGIRG